MVCIPHYSGDQIKKKEKDEACCTYGGQESCTQSFCGDTLRKENT